MAQPKPKGDSAQRQRFIETAKELGCDQDEEAFRKKLGEIAKAKPEPKKG